MNIRRRLQPYSTIHLRLLLKLEGAINRFIRSRMLTVLGAYYGGHFCNEKRRRPRLYLRSRIHPYPGLGHQVSVWISGLLWANDLSLQYLGGQVSKNGGLLDLADLGPERNSEQQRIVAVQLPPTSDERNPLSAKILEGAIRRAIRRHRRADAIVFTAALDNPRFDQVPASLEIRRAFLCGPLGREIEKREALPALKVVIHIRRGDVSVTSEASGSGLPRWIPEEFYVHVIENLRTAIRDPLLEVEVISLGSPQDFPMLSAMERVQLRLNGSSADDLVRLVSADILVAAPSSFSFTAGLASQGAVLALHPWWHAVPDEGRWFRLDRKANFDHFRLGRLVAERCRPGAES